MTSFAVTGSTGMLGWHAVARLRAASASVITIGREDFADVERLGDRLAGIDVVLHFAGMNRGPEGEIEEVNSELALRLVDALRCRSLLPKVVFADSVHKERSDAYGRSKRLAAEILSGWSADSGARFVDLVLPHVFGEGGRPFHNSVVSTFAYQLCVGEEPTVDRDGALELIHAQDVVDVALRPADGSGPLEIRVSGIPTTVSELLAELRGMHRSYVGASMPDISDRFRASLFNVLRSHRAPGRPVDLQAHADDRGRFIELVRAPAGGQTSFSVTRPGVTRGNHYHFRKIERFVVLSGRGSIRMRRLLSNDVAEIVVSGDDGVAIDMPTMYTHSITNVGTGDLLTMFWVNELFDPADPDTYAEAVEAGAS